MELKLGETAYFDFPTHNSTGEVADASIVACEVFEDANDIPIISPTPVKRIGKTGNYRVQIDATTVNGFEVDKTYNIVASATTDKAGKGTIATFKVRANHIGELALDSTVAKPGDEMSLTTGERTAIANEVEAQIIDETDAEKVLTAITNKIAQANPDLSGLTLSAIASAIRTELTTELARINDTITSRQPSGAVALVPTQRVKLDASQPDYAPVTSAELATHEANSVDRQTVNIAEHDATQALVNEKVIGSTSINIVSATKGAIQVSYGKTGGVIEVVKGDTISIPYGPLGKDITGRKLYFAAKQLLTDATYKIAVKEITAQVTNAATFTGTIPLTSAELALTPGNYYAEVESRAADGVSSPVTEMKFILKVVDQVIG